MNGWIGSMGVIALMILILGVFAIVQSRKLAEIQKQHPGHPKGYWLNRGIAIGLPIGVGVGVALGNIAIGVALGAGVGIAIGSSLEQKHQDELRPLTDEEVLLQRQSLLMGGATFLFGLIVFVLIFYLAR